VYRLAQVLNCKGVTIYRDGSRNQQVLNKGLGTDKDGEDSIPGRPRVLQGFTTKLNTGQGSLYVTINTDEHNHPIEVFSNIGKSGGDTAALAEAIGRLISISLQKGVEVEEISQTLIGITGSRPVWNEGTLVKSVPDGIGQILLNYFGIKAQEVNKAAVPGASKIDPVPEPHTLSGPECPECGCMMETEGGCIVCRTCGYSHCG
jgi:ribonucleoside-diphosphate reductase alpha chain